MSKEVTKLKEALNSLSQLSYSASSSKRQSQQLEAAAGQTGCRTSWRVGLFPIAAPGLGQVGTSRKLPSLKSVASVSNDSKTF